MSRLHLGCVVLVLAVSLDCPARGRADTDTEYDELKKRVLEARKRLLHLRAESAVLQLEQKAIAAPREGTTTPPDTELGVPETLRAILDSPAVGAIHDLDKHGQDRDQALNALVSENNSRRVVACWEQASGDSLRLLDDLAAEEARLHLHLASLGPGLRPLWSARRSWLRWDGVMARTVFWMWLIVTASLWLYARVGRRERRRWWRGRGEFSRLVLGLALAVACLAWLAVLGLTAAKLREARLPPIGAPPDAGPRAALRVELRQEEQRLQAEADASESKKEELRQQADAQLDKAFAAWRERLGIAKKSQLEAAERGAAQKVRDALVRIHEMGLLAAEAREASAQMSKDREAFTETVVAGQQQAVAWAWMRLAILGLLVLVPVAPTLVLVWRQARRHRRASRECPRCAAQEELKTVIAPVRDDRFPEPKYINCQRCMYQFPESYRSLTRVCFPTIGLTGSGKTTWLLECYAQIAEGELPADVQMTKAPSLGDQEFDRMVRQWRTRNKMPGRTAATEGQFPYPVTLHVKDLDAAPNQVLVNLFDFGGEMTGRGIDMSVLRRRALMMDGFIFFLDPTRSMEEYGLQQAELIRFAQEARRMRKLREGAQLDVPVAVCLPKLDLLPQTEFSGRAKAWLRKLRQTQGLPATSAVLRQRSRLVREALLPLFPGWPVEDNLRDNFGNKFLFFPLTPIGFEEKELATADSADLRDRTLAAFGVTEPLLWLLHMHGYRVLR
jgi:hypothetical protein